MGGRARRDGLTGSDGTRELVGARAVQAAGRMGGRAGAVRLGGGAGWGQGSRTG